MNEREYFKSDLALKIWNDKYRHNEETFEQWLDRVSGGYEGLRKLILDKKFLFAGRILANRGLDKEGIKVTYSNCYVLEQPQDNLESIYDTAKYLARTFSYGGGCGIDLAKLRPRGAKVHNSAKVTTGAVSFMPTYSEVTGTIGQNNRRGALMISMPVSHPDIEEFIDIKRDLSKVTKANISVRVTEDFMEAVKYDNNYLCQFTVEDTGEYITKEVNAKKLFMRLCENNWDYAEPGILYWDRIKSWNILSEYDNFEYAGVNPCAEEPLPAGGSCLLGSINLSAYVRDAFTDKAKFNYKAFSEDVQVVVKGLDNVLEEGLELHPLQTQRDTVRDWRQIGLGVMGLADMLVKMGIEYGSEESRHVSNKVASTLLNSALMSSSKLSALKGTFPMYDKEKTLASPFIKGLCTDEVYEHIEKYGLRHSQILTSAPTGSISTMLEISGGIEPIYSIKYTRKTESIGEGDEYHEVYTSIIKEVMEEYNVEEELLPKFATTTALTIKPIDRIKMQSVWQNYIDASISSTINLPKEATLEEVADIYMSAYEMGLKGVTIYRAGCKREGILVANPIKDKLVELRRGEKKPIAEDTIYYKKEIQIGCGELELFIGYSPIENALQDFWVKRKGNGGCECNIEGQVISMSLLQRVGASFEMLKTGFNGMSQCNSFTNARAKGRKLSKGTNCSQAIFNTLEAFVQEKTIPQQEIKIVEPTPKGNLCPKCKEPLRMTEGCMSCPSCGYSKCN